MKRHTDDLKYQIERILRWEPSAHWRPRDYRHLSERVMAHTNHWVEAYDLHQFWISSVATPGLLDALAQFADYHSWEDFCLRNQTGEMVPHKADAFHSPRHEIPARWITLIWWLSVLVAVAIGLLLVWKR